MQTYNSFNELAADNMGWGGLVSDMTVFNLDISYANREIKDMCTEGTSVHDDLSDMDKKVILKRLQQMRSAPTLADLAGSRQLNGQPDKKGNFHELAGNRAGQIACTLDGGNRLIFKPRYAPTKANGRLDWSKVTSVVILETNDYHND